MPVRRLRPPPTPLWGVDGEADAPAKGQGEGRGQRPGIHHLVNFIDCLPPRCNPPHMLARAGDGEEKVEEDRGWRKKRVRKRGRRKGKMKKWRRRKRRIGCEEEEEEVEVEGEEVG